MAKKLEIYKCDHCGNMVEVLIGTQVPLVCCGKPMTLLVEQTADSSAEKHVPYIEELEDGYRVRVGENQNHPMMEKHYIQWIELIAGNNVYRKELMPNDLPEATFKVEKVENVIAREYCNLHGLWKATL